jgi:hypothetical protein
LSRSLMQSFQFVIFILVRSLINIPLNVFYITAALYFFP